MYSLTYSVISRKFELLAKYSQKLHVIHEAPYFNAREAVALQHKIDDEMQSVKQLLNKVKQ